MTRPHDPFDTYLLRVLSTLLAEGSVSRAAARLNQSQPAVSAALRRLREIFDDPLFVKDKQRMVPTERARQLEGSLRIVLGEMEALLAPGEDFDPATSRRAFRIGMPDYLAPTLVAAMVGYMRMSAPRAQLSIVALGPDYDYERALAEGEVDIVVGNWPQPPDHLRMAILIEDEVVCLVDRGHAGAAGMSVAQYLAGSHVVPHPYSVLQRGVVESHLAQLRLSRESTVATPYFCMAPYLLVGSDLIFTTSRHFAEHHAAILPLAVVPSPIAFPTMRFYQLWHNRTHLSQAHAWLRSLLSAVARTADATRELRAPRPGAGSAQVVRRGA